MAKLQGTILVSKIVPTDSLDTYATHEDEYGRGGHRSVDTLEERDNITTPRRKEGMTVYVKENKTKYILENGIENANWKVDSSGGGSGVQNVFIQEAEPTIGTGTSALWIQKSADGSITFNLIEN